MGLRKIKFTPEVLLSAPRRSSGIPSPSGNLVLYTESTYSFEKHETHAEVRVLTLSTSETELVVSGSKYSNPVWLDNGLVAMLRSIDEDETELVVGPLFDFQCDSSYVVGTIPGPADNLKVVKLKAGTWGIAVTGQANPDGSFYNPTKAPKPKSSARIYDQNFVRHWDRYTTPERNSIFYAALTTDDKKRISLSPLINALESTGLESPIPPWGGKDHFDISKSGIVFVAKDPVLDPALNTMCNIYHLPLSSFESKAKLRTTKLKGIDGALTSPVFSHDGTKIAFLGMKTNGYESDQNHILVIDDVEKLSHYTVHTYSHFSPSSVRWARDDHVVYFTAEQQGSVGLFAFTPEGGKVTADEPKRLFSDRGSVHSIHFLSSGEDDSGAFERVLLSSASLIESQIYTVLEVRLGQHDLFSAKSTFRLAQGGPSFGLTPGQVAKFHSEAADPSIAIFDNIESWMVKPSDFDKSQKYPLALLIHGGPQGAWGDDWSTRWNPAVFAEQGYVVVCPNITGSTGYGQRLTDGIKGQWGGLPYKDLELLFSALEQVSYIDTSRSVALGASYGGFMANWIQGQPLGRKFKALVTHDGVFSTAFQVSTDELYFVHHDFEGRWSEHRAGYEKWDPARFTAEWATPHLVIHSEKDFRLSMADGLAAFNVLQTRGVPSRFLTFPDENHWVLKPENSLVWHETVFGWINKHVGLPKWKPTSGGSASENVEVYGRVKVEGRIEVVE